MTQTLTKCDKCGTTATTEIDGAQLCDTCQGQYLAQLRQEINDYAEDTEPSEVTITDKDVGDETDTEDEWPDPIPLRGARPRPSFPVGVMPEWIAEQAIQVAQEFQFTPDLPAQFALAALSTALTRRVEIEISGPWTEGVNLYLVTAMKPSSGKSPAMRRMTDPITDWESELVEQEAHNVKMIAADRKRIQHRIDKAGKADDKDAMTTAIQELETVPEAFAPEIVGDDITPEALAVSMSEQNGRMALLTAEGGDMFQMMGGRYTDTSNLGIYLGSWSGDDVRQKRITRDDVKVSNARLTLGLAVQPTVVTALGDNPEFSGRGLVARFMFSVPVDPVGTRDKRRKSTFDKRLDASYARKMTNIADSHYKAPLRTLTIAPEALDAFQDWQQSHEDRLGFNGDLEHLAEWVVKMESSVCRVAALFHVADETPGDEVDLETMLRAMAIGNYWEDHAEIAGDMWGADPAVSDALRVLDWAARRDSREFTIRDLMRGLRSLFPTAESTHEALWITLENGFVRVDDKNWRISTSRGTSSPKFTLRGDYAPNLTLSEHVSSVSRVPKGIKKHTSSLLKKEYRDGAPLPVTRDTGDTLQSEPVDNSESPTVPATVPATNLEDF